MLTINQEFHRLLTGRGMTINKLSQLTRAGRSHLSQVLANKPGRGSYTRRKLFAVLTVAEIIALGWSEEYVDWQAKKNSGAGLTKKNSDVPMGASQLVQG